MAAVFAAILPGSGGARAAEPPPTAAALVEFTPTGTVKQVRQAVARFATPMVAYGDPESPVDPFTVDCPVPGSGRWIDARTWVYDFERTLPGGLRCAFRPRPDSTDLAGARVAAADVYAFDTGGPAIAFTIPGAGEKIEAEQAFVLQLDAAPADESIERNATFAVEGIAERVGVRLLSGDERARILATWPGREWEGPVVILAARRRFPDDAEVRLLWGPGIATPSGATTTLEQSFEYRVRPPFKAELRCQRESPRAGCIPLTPIVLRFTAPVPWAMAKDVTLTGPGGVSYAARPPESPEQSVSQLVFAGPFPESTTLELAVPSELTDDSGRALQNAAALRPLPVVVAADPPLAKFPSRFAIVELEADPALPVTIRSLGAKVVTRELHLDADAGQADGRSADRAPAAGGQAKVGGSLLHLSAARSSEIQGWLRKVAAARRDRSIFGAKPGSGEVRTLELPELSGEELQVVGIPLPRPGVYVVEIESRRLGEALLGKPKPLYVPAAALVTNMAVHLEWGAAGSLVWVTRLSDARPVDSAEVAVHDCAGRVLWNGTTDGQGIARIAELPERDAVPLCRTSSDAYSDPHYDYRATRALSGLDGGLFVTARSGDDVSFVHSSWDLGIEPYRFDLPQESWNGPFVAHTVLDRALLRAGETLHMKHVFRVETLGGFAFADAAARPARASIRHLGSDTRYDLALAWREDGSAATDWAIPREAKLGRYEIYLVRPPTGEVPGPDATPRPTASPAPPYARLGDPGESFEREWLAGSFRVEEFRVPLARGVVKLPAEAQVDVREVPVDLAVDYLAGGGAADLPVVLRSQIEPASISPKGFDDFTFASGAVKVGIEREGPGPADEPDASAKRAIHQREELRLDAAGTARARITDIPAESVPKLLRAELEFRDPNGEIQTSVATVPLWPARVVAGIDVDVRPTRAPRLETRVVALGPGDVTLARAPVVVEAFERLDYTVRKRVVGGFYAYEYVRETKPLGTLCSGRTRSDGTFRCRRRAPAAGNVVVQATVRDARGRASVTHRDVWVADDTDFWFRATADDRMDVLPDARRYEPGQVARLQVRMPFRSATALVTLAREGVLDARVVELSGKDPTVVVPVTDAFSPNMFVSVLAVRGRVGDVQPTARIDLGKPAFRLGVAELVVGWEPHRLDVEVSTDRPVYRVREKARATVVVRPAAGGSLPPGSSVAFAAIDEGLLELAPNPSWELLRAMMGRRGFGVWTATGQMEVVGKRHYGLKARPEGGGGGRQTTRELFETLLLWRADVALDASGRAEVEIPLNDSLTSFRVVAVATGGTGLFGTGETSLRTTQDLMLFSGLPPVVRTGDSFFAEFTVRNTLERSLRVELRGRVEGGPGELEPLEVELAPGEARVVGWEIAVPDEATELRYSIDASVEGGPGDRLAVAQRVVPAVPTRVVQATLAQVASGRPFAMPVAAPAGALSGRGGLELGFAPSLVGGLDATRDFMRRYPYTCLEQRVSRAVVLEDVDLWNAVVAALPAHADENGLLKFFPSMRFGSELLSAYVLGVARAAGLALPEDVESKLESALRGFVDGSLGSGAPGTTRTVDLPLRKLAALAALAGDGGIDPELLAGIPIDANLWPPSALLDWWSILARSAAIEDRGQRLAEVQRVIRARLEVGGTTVVFRDASADSWSVFAGPDVSAARLVLRALDAPEWRDEAPRLLRGTLARQERGVWATTVADAWGAIATRAFVHAFEGEPVRGTTRASLEPAGGKTAPAATAGTEPRGVPASAAAAAATPDATTGADPRRRAELDWRADPEGGTRLLAWPPGAADLRIAHDGAGRPWVNVRAAAAIPLEEPLAAGYRIVKHMEPARGGGSSGLAVGDVLHVRLEIEAQAAMPWVVVDDPVPAGASHLGAVPPPAPDPGAEPGSAAQPTFVERSFEAYRAYFEELPAGRTVVRYAIRLNQSGRFLLPPTRVAALYAPETFGEIPNASIEVGR